MTNTQHLGVSDGVVPTTDQELEPTGNNETLGGATSAQTMNTTNEIVKQCSQIDAVI